MALKLSDLNDEFLDLEPAPGPKPIALSEIDPEAIDGLIEPEAPPAPEPPAKPAYGPAAYLKDAGLAAAGQLVSGTAAIPRAIESQARQVMRSSLSQGGRPGLMRVLGVDTTGIDQAATDQEREAAVERALAEIPRIGAFESWAKWGEAKEKDIKAGMSPQGKTAMEKPTFEGNLLRGEFSIGDDATLAGAGLQIAGVLGSFLPTIAATLLTRRAGAGATVGGGMAGGEALRETEQFVGAQSDEALYKNSPLFRHMVDAGESPERARALTVNKAGEAAALYQGLVAGLGDQFTGKLILGAFDNLLARSGSRAVRGAAAGGVGALEEGFQETGEGIASDIGIQRAVQNKEIGEGSAENFALGAAGGGIVGGAKGLMSDSPGQALGRALREDVNATYLPRDQIDATVRAGLDPTPNAAPIPRGPITRALSVGMGNLPATMQPDQYDDTGLASAAPPAAPEAAPIVTPTVGPEAPAPTPEPAPQVKAQESPAATIPDSLISEFPDFGLTAEGYIAVSRLRSDEQEALKNAGLVQQVTPSETDEDGQTRAPYDAVDPEVLWMERKRRQDAGRSKPQRASDQERDAALEKRAAFYDQLANEEEAKGDLGYQDKIDTYRAKAAEIRSQKSGARATPAQAEPPRAPDQPDLTLAGVQATEPGAERKPDESPQNRVSGLEVIEAPVADLQLSRDVPQFKEGANEQGVVEPLGGRFDRRGVAPIQVWERMDGRREVISGRHRLDLARRSGETTIPAQIHREADGFTVEQARSLDAELNIRDGQGKAIDYVDYFQAQGITEEQAKQEGLVARNPGRRAFTLATSGGEALIAQVRAGGISDTDAERITLAAPGNEALQAVAIDQMVNKGAGVNRAVGTMQAVQALAGGGEAQPETLDLFGFNDSRMREAEPMGTIAAKRQTELSRDILAISGASKRPEVAKRYGVDVKDPEALKAKLAELKQQRTAWGSWPTNPELVAQVRAEMEGEQRGKGQDAAKAPMGSRATGNRGAASKGGDRVTAGPGTLAGPGQPAGAAPEGKAPAQPSPRFVTTRSSGGHPADNYDNWNALTDDEVKRFAKAAGVKPGKTRSATLDRIDELRRAEKVAAWDTAIGLEPETPEPAKPQPKLEPAGSADVDPETGLTDEEARAIYKEKQELMRGLPRDIGKAMREGKLGPERRARVERLHELEKKLPTTSAQERKLHQEASEQREKDAEGWRAEKRAEAQKVLDRLGFKEGDQVEIYRPPMFIGAPATHLVGTVKIGKNGQAYVAVPGEGQLDIERNPWEKVKPEPTPLELTGQTPEEVAAEEARKRQEQEQTRDEERKAKADAQVDDFVLTGSDRPVDEAEARGQGNLFDAPAPKKEDTPAPGPRPDQAEPIPTPALADLEFVKLGVKSPDTGKIPEDARGRIAVRFNPGDGTITVGNLVNRSQAYGEDTETPWETSDGQRFPRLPEAKRHEYETQVLPYLRREGYLADAPEAEQGKAPEVSAEPPGAKTAETEPTPQQPVIGKGEPEVSPDSILPDPDDLGAMFDDLVGAEFEGEEAETPAAEERTDKEEAALLRRDARDLRKRAAEANKESKGRASRNLVDINTDGSYVPVPGRAAKEYRELLDRAELLEKRADALDPRVKRKPSNPRLTIRAIKTKPAEGGSQNGLIVTNIPQRTLDALGWTGVWFMPGEVQTVYAQKGPIPSQLNDEVIFEGKIGGGGTQLIDAVNARLPKKDRAAGAKAATAKSAAGNLTAGAKEAMEGLVALFDPGKGTLGSGPVFNEEGRRYEPGETEVDAVQERRKRAPVPDAQLAFDLEPAPEVQVQKIQAADNFHAIYKHVTVDTLRTAVDRIRPDLSLEDQARAVAHVMASLRKLPVEEFYALVLDKGGRILEVQRHSIGTRDGASVFPETVAPSIAAVPEAASAWFIHNHPSGAPQPSQADLRITSKLVDSLDGSGIKAGMHVVIGAGNTAHYFTQDARGITKEGGAITHPAALRNKTVPVVERRVRKVAPKDRPFVTDPETARAVVDAMEAENGIALLDNKHGLVGTLALTHAEASALREGNTVRRVLAAIDTTNASAAVVKSKLPNVGGNIARFLASSGTTRVLGVFYEGMDGALRSNAEQGQPVNEPGAWFSRSGRPGMTPAKIEAAVASVIAEWKGRARVVIVRSPQDPRVPEALRQSDAEHLARGSGDAAGAYYDGTVYLFSDGIESPAHAIETLAHEMLVHHGLRGAFGKALEPILESLAHARRADVARKAAEYGLDMNKRAERLLAAEELLAEMGQTQPTAGFVRRAVAAIRAWLRRHGFDLKLSDSEIIVNFLLPARQFVESGRRAGERNDAGPTFARKPPRLKKGLDRVIRDALTFESSKDWYDRHEDVLREHFEEDAEVFRDILAITSQGATVASNVVLALKAYRQIRLGLPLEGVGIAQSNLSRYLAGEEVGGQKISAFLAAMRGDPGAVVVDRWMARYLFGVDTPTRGQVKKAHDVLNKAARRLGWQTREVQAAIWAHAITEAGETPSDYAAEIGKRADLIRDTRGRIAEAVQGSYGSEAGGQGAGADADGGGAQGPGGGVRFARRPPSGNPTLDEARRRIGQAPPATLRQRLSGVLGSVFDAISTNRAEHLDVLRQGTLDQFYGILRRERQTVGNLPREQSAYVTARLANGISSVMRAVLLHGAPRWAANTQHLERIPGTRGLLDILSDVGEDLDDWLGWMAGNRAARLLREGRENNLTEDHIKALQALGTPERIERFRKAAREFAAFKRAILDVAEQAGLIDPESRAVWDNADWIPFYRNMAESGAERTIGPRGKRGLANQSSGIRTLRGGESETNDLLENIMMNFHHLLDASLKNNALQKAVGIGGDFVERLPQQFQQRLIPNSEVKRMLRAQGTPEDVLDLFPPEVFAGISRMWSFATPSEPNVIRVMEGGRPVYYRVTDPLLLRAVTSFERFDFPGLKTARAFRRVLTASVTATPAFMLRNFLRDTLSTQIIAEDRPGITSAFRGAARTWRETGYAEQMLFAGASFAAGYIEGTDPEAVARSMRRSLRARGLSAAAVDGYMASIVDLVGSGWDQYRRINEALENANREAVFERVIKSGGSATAAAFESKDLMDFSLRGAWAGYQILADVIPFFNARVQGLYRLGRANPRALAVRGALLLILPSVLLAIANLDNDDYKELPDWDKDTYWHFWIGKEHFRIPKPFELGLAFGTMPERAVHALAGNISAKKLLQRFAWGVTETLNLAGPITSAFGIQALAPIAEAASNWDAFRGREIEHLGDEKVSPHLRYSGSTSDFARVLLGATAPVTDLVGLSPKRFEHLVEGYLGSVGGLALSILDWGTRLATGAPEQPTWRVDEIPLLNVLYRGSGQNPPKYTQYIEDVYKGARAYETVRGDFNKLKRDGKDEAAAALLERHAERLDALQPLYAASKTLRKASKATEAIYRDAEMSPVEKRAELDAIMRERNELARDAVRMGLDAR